MTKQNKLSTNRTIKKDTQLNGWQSNTELGEPNEHKQRQKQN